MLNPINPLLIDIPEEFETERLVIRAAQPGEGAAVNEAVRESHAELRSWLTWAETVQTVEQSEAQARDAHAKFHARADLIYRGWLKGTNEFVTGSGLHRIDWTVPRFEIGYFCRTRFVGQGYVSEAVHALARLAFETLKAARVEIRCDELNERSWRVAERCGFTLEGTLRNNARAPDGSLRDIRVYAKVAPS
jgi:RimJ/RimL family protein N-acetyltransferase